MVGYHSGAAECRCSVPGRIYGGHHKCREHPGSQVPWWHCRQSLRRSKAGFTERLHFESVEIHALFGIESGQFQYFAALHRSDRHVVVKEHRTGSPGGDFGMLKTGFRKDQHLRIHVYTQVLQERRQITQAVRSELELHLAAFDLLAQTGDGIVHREIAILDGWIFDRNPAVLVHLGQQTGNGEQTHTAEE